MPIPNFVRIIDVPTTEVPNYETQKLVADLLGEGHLDAARGSNINRQDDLVQILEILRSNPATAGQNRKVRVAITVEIMR